MRTRTEFHEAAFSAAVTTKTTKRKRDNHKGRLPPWVGHIPLRRGVVLGRLYDKIYTRADMVVEVVRFHRLCDRYGSCGTDQRYWAERLVAWADRVAGKVGLVDDHCDIA